MRIWRWQGLELALKIIHVVLAAGVIINVLLQPGRSAGMGAIGGGAQTFFGKRKGLEEKLARITTAFAVLFMLSSVLLAFIIAR
ncbi:MAG: preprotein translocase subunit SecG [Firmicutes bacterium]|nr:preprotein translocase subunit SecG [Bacillota bacterium]